MNISGRRATHSMSHIPPIVNTIVELILALGSTACFAILIYHLETYAVWNRSTEISMIVLLVILAYVKSYNGLIGMETNRCLDLLITSSLRGLFMR
jgi:hypothetical protein